MFPESLFHWQKNALLKPFALVFRANPFTRQYDKRAESERQMLQRVTIKFVALILLISMFDSIIDWFLGILDFIMHLVHLVIEAIEYLLELLLMNSLNTDAQQSETIIVNAMIILSLFLVYRLLLALPRLAVRFKRNSRAAWLRYKRRQSSCWRAMSLSYKIKWLCAHSLGTTCVLFFLG